MHKKSVPMQWRAFKNKYHLNGTHCDTCGDNFYPPRAICPKCRRKGKIVEKHFAGVGKVVTFTEIYAPPAGYEKGAPYFMAIVKLEGGPSVAGQVVDIEPEQMKIGLKVEANFRKIYVDGEEGIIQYGLKFVPKV